MNMTKGALERLERELVRRWGELERATLPSPERLLDDFEARERGATSWTAPLLALALVAGAWLASAAPEPAAARAIEEGGLRRGGELVHALERMRGATW